MVEKDMVMRDIHSHGTRGMWLHVHILGRVESRESGSKVGLIYDP